MTSGCAEYRIDLLVVYLSFLLFPSFKMSSIDYTPVLLAQLTDLQMRVTKQDALIAALSNEVEKLSGRKVTVNDVSTMRTSVPLRSHNDGPKPYYNDGPKPYHTHGDGPKPYDGSKPQRNGPPRNGYERPAGYERSATYERSANREQNNDTRAPRSRPRVSEAERTPRPTMSLADVLRKDEVVDILVHTGKDEGGNFIDSTAVATFDGTDLTVTECEMVSSLVGMKSSKPGEILYKFIDELKSSGHIKRTFTIAPWKLCFVTRSGVKQSLEDLRTTIG